MDKLTSEDGALVNITAEIMVGLECSGFKVEVSSLSDPKRKSAILLVVPNEGPTDLYAVEIWKFGGKGNLQSKEPDDAETP